ncbi:MAG: hypothetical protein ABH851_06125 [Methanobacteriota archaeon]
MHKHFLPKDAVEAEIVRNIEVMCGRDEDAAEDAMGFLIDEGDHAVPQLLRRYAFTGLGSNPVAHYRLSQTVAEIGVEVPEFAKTLVTKVAGEDEKSPVALTALAVREPEQLIGCANIAHMTEMTLIGTALHLQGPNAFLLLVHEIDSGDRERVVKGLTLMGSAARHLHDPGKNPERVVDNLGTYDFLVGEDLEQHLAVLKSPDDTDLNQHIKLFERVVGELRQRGPPGS